MSFRGSGDGNLNTSSEFQTEQRVALGVNDEARAERILDGVVGKRLTYETTKAR